MQEMLVLVFENYLFSTFPAVATKSLHASPLVKSSCIRSIGLGKQVNVTDKYKFYKFYIQYTNVCHVFHLCKIVY